MENWIADYKLKLSLFVKEVENLDERIMSKYGIDRNLSTNIHSLMVYLNDESYINDLVSSINEKSIGVESNPLNNLRKDIIEGLKNIDNSIIGINGYNNTLDNIINISQVISYVFNISNILSQFRIKGELESFDILRHLSGHDKTLVIIGPNGSGKTSLANCLKKSDTHVKVIPASKPLKVRGYINSNFNTTIEKFNNEIY